MRRQVRRSTFETNSSSMHSLVVTKNNEYFTQEEIEKDIWLFDGTIDGKDMDYGRSPFRVLYGLKDKAMYAIASLCEYKDETYNRICNVIRSYLPGFKDFDLDFDTKVWTDDISEKRIKSWYGEDNYVKQCGHWISWGFDMGYVDEDILTGFLREENITIEEFLKNKRYIVIVDGDEYCIYKDMKEHGLINTNNIVREYPER